MGGSCGVRLLCAASVAAAYGCGAAVATVTDEPVPVGETPRAGAAQAPVGARADRADTGTARMVPAGHGSLKQDDITISLRAGAVLVKVTPMDEATIRLLAPDTHGRLSALRESRRTGISQADARAAELFLVSFFSYEPDQAFQPENVQLVYQSRLLRPARVMPVSGGWGQQRLGQQETQTAVYVFEGPIDYAQSFTVIYDLVESNEWQRIVPLLETERARVLTRSAGPG